MATAAFEPGTSSAKKTSPKATAKAARPTWLRWVRAVGFLLAVGVVVGAPWWGPLALARLDYFHARRVVFEGVRYARPTELIARLKVDTLQSVWQPLEPLVERIAAHPMVASVAVERQLPGTLLIRVVEREPVAYVPRKGRLEPADATGRPLPIDPARYPLDVPVAASADSSLLHLLDGLRKDAPRLYARVSHGERAGTDEMRFKLGGVTVRTSSDVTVARFKDILPVEADLARNHLRAVELDLRFRDQVIARQP
ncbi:cell division protein FtsQ/DivIB [Gemmatimonas groenlandica]|uniref:FtsQ-type POTRA domain-containing protein n=1 Tax=Gemmatimonas groenlandica TaxID=2732249 RepID=A0A6M4INH1_9BACT|nr:FtsQ-type POTRA domain-containing protein [Gemmatimonas groenlandica]QJR35299.1 FtsQ-type POTRA domain-containing protein [Gemmatimonas groenlandica]